MTVLGGGRSARVTRRGLLKRAWASGVGVAAMALVGCGGPETFNSRRDGDTGGDDGVPSRSGPVVRDGGAAGGESGVRDDTVESPAAAGEAARIARSAAAPPIEAPAAPDLVVDPLVWRERYHWRHLAQGSAQGGDGDFNDEQSSVLSVHVPAPHGWLPFASLALPSAGSMLPLLCSQLVVMAAGDDRDAHRGEIEGDLASGWEIPEPATVLFRLREDVEWPDEEPLRGRRLTASDARAAHEALRSPSVRQSAAYEAVERIEADDRAATVAFHLREPASYLLAKMTDPWHVVTTPEYAGKLEGRVADETQYVVQFEAQDLPRGTGPFILKYANVASWGLERNPRYFKREAGTGRRLPHLNEIRGGVLMSGTTPDVTSAPRELAWADWAEGEFDAMELLAPSELARSEELFADVQGQVAAPTPGRGSELEFRDGGAGRLADARVRRALSAAVDRKALADIRHEGLAEPDCGHDWTHVTDEASASGFREWPWSADELGESHRFDPAYALSLLDAAGVHEGEPLQLGVDASPSRAAGPAHSADEAEVAAVAHQWQAHLGPLASVRLLPGQVETVLRNGSMEQFLKPDDDAAVLSVPSRVRYAADPDDLTHGRLHSSRRSPVRDAALDDLCERQRGELDAARRSEILEQIRKRDMELAWRLTLVNPYGLMARRGGVFNVGATHIAHGFDLNPKQFERARRAPR